MFLFRLLWSDQEIQQGSMVHVVVNRCSCLGSYRATRGSSKFHGPWCRNQLFLFRLLWSDQENQQGSMVHGVVTRRSCLDCYGTTRGSSNASTGSLSTRSLSGSTPLPDSESFKSKYLMQIITQTGPSPPTLVFYIIEISLLLPHDSIRRL